MQVLQSIPNIKHKNDSFQNDITDKESIEDKEDKKDKSQNNMQ